MKKNPFLFLAMFCLGIGIGKAQYTVLLNFNGTNSPQGANPDGDCSLVIAGKILYGMTTYGGIHDAGCIFSVDSNGNEYKDLLDFNWGNGALPYGSLTLANGKLFGMTFYGGAHDSGCIFSIDTNGNNYKDLFDFDEKTNVNPYGSLIVVGGKLFGMVTDAWPALSYGNIFSIDTNGREYRDLFDFNGVNGKYPYGSLIISNNKLYGLTSYGGVYDSVTGFGNIFSIDTSGNGYKNLHNFNDTNGANPYSPLTIIGGVLYGMTTYGGTNERGCIFSVDTDSNNYKDLGDFNGINGANPQGSLVFSGGSLYGMSPDGGAGDGNIFSINSNGSNFKRMFHFNDTNGSQPRGTLSLFGNSLYGMTALGGIYNDGVIFKIDTNTIDLDSTLSINTIFAHPNGIRAYPNPNNGKFTIESPLVSGTFSIEIYNVLGDQLKGEELRLTGNEVELCNMPSGIYFLRVTNCHRDLIGDCKIIIQK